MAAFFMNEQICGLINVDGNVYEVRLNKESNEILTQLDGSVGWMNVGGRTAKSCAEALKVAEDSIRSNRVG